MYQAEWSVGVHQEFYLDLIGAKTSTRVASATLVILSNEDPYTGGHRVTVFFFLWGYQQMRSQKMWIYIDVQ
jgi:peroxiredoxin family protein